MRKIYACVCVCHRGMGAWRQGVHLRIYLDFRRDLRKSANFAHEDVYVFHEDRRALLFGITKCTLANNTRSLHTDCTRLELAGFSSRPGWWIDLTLSETCPF